MADPDYDEIADEWRRVGRRLLAAGSDDPDSTAADMREQLDNLIQEENE